MKPSTLRIHDTPTGAAPHPAPAPGLRLPQDPKPDPRPGPWPVPEDGSGPMLPPALNARRIFFGSGDGRMAAYWSNPGMDGRARGKTPLVLLHSVNAAASAAEVRPIFDAVQGSRPLVALELPGFGSSPRHERAYSPELMTHALLAAVDEVRHMGVSGEVDLLAVSLSCEFAARAALIEPTWFRTLSLVSPTGLESRHLETYEDGRSKAKPWLHALLERGPWAESLFRLLTREKSMRKFLERAWGSKQIDETLLAYNRLSVKPAGARHAPYAFIAGALFTRGVAHLYEQLPQPVWVAHGIRGNFAKFDGIKSIKPAAKWTVDSFDAGAMPYFETPDEFLARLDSFLGGVETAESHARWADIQDTRS